MNCNAQILAFYVFIQSNFIQFFSDFFNSNNHHPSLMVTWNQHEEFTILFKSKFISCQDFCGITSLLLFIWISSISFATFQWLDRFFHFFPVFGLQLIKVISSCSIIDYNIKKLNGVFRLPKYLNLLSIINNNKWFITGNPKSFLVEQHNKIIWIQNRSKIQILLVICISSLNL